MILKKYLRHIWQLKSDTNTYELYLFVVQTFIAWFDVSKEVCARICILIIYIPAGSNTCYNLP